MMGQPTPNSETSFDNVQRTVAIPRAGLWRRIFAFAGPAYMVSVGYMDPGNWATDLEGGAQFGYRLIWVLLMSNAMAVLLQTLSVRLGLVTGRDLAQACRDAYNPFVRWVLFVLCEIAIGACDLAELLGTAIGLNLLFGIPLTWAVLVTGFDVFLLLAIQRFGVRKLEAFILLLISTIGLCFVIEIFLSGPSASRIASGFIPRALSGKELYIAIGILGATVMPHNLYLHSALVQSRDVHRSKASVAQACRFNLIDSVVALNCAFFVNAAILIVSAATFWSRGIEVTEIQQAHYLLHNVLGSRLAPIVFAVALICAGQSSTVTGTLAGQITMEGFLHFRIRPAVRRLVTRLVAIVPCVAVIMVMGDQGTYKLLILSQVILSLQLPFAVVPLVKFTNSREKMGPFANRHVIRWLAWAVTAIIILLNAKLVSEEVGTWIAQAGPYRWLVMGTLVPLAVGLGGLLLWMIAQTERPAAPAPSVSPDDVVASAVGQRFKRIGVALEATDGDGSMLAEGIAFAKAHEAELVLMHVVEGVGGQWYGPQTGDTERRHDDAYLADLADRLRAEVVGRGVRDVKAVLGFGNVPRELVRLAKQEEIDLMVMGGHGHGRLADWILGQTIPEVRHGAGIPIFTVRSGAEEQSSVRKRNQAPIGRAK